MPSLLSDPYIDSGQLVVILADSIGTHYGLHLLWPTNKHATPRLLEFVSFFHEHLSNAARYESRN